MARGAHEGSIGRHKSGLYSARLQVDGHRRTVYAKTRREAETRLHELKQAVIDGDGLATRDARLADLIATYLSSSKSGWSFGTFQGYESLARKHVLPKLGRRAVRKINTQVLQAFLNELTSSGCSSDLVHHIKRLLSAVFAKGVVWGVVNRNPCDHLSLPKHSQIERPRLSEDDVRRFLASLQGDRLESLFVVLVTTGFRISETLGLTEPDLDLSAGTIRVRRQLQQVESGALALVDLKTRGSHRVVEIGPSTVRSLLEHRAKIAEERLRAGSIWQGDLQLVFPNNIGKPLSLSNVRKRIFKPAARKADLPLNTTIHDLRHAFAAFALSRGQDIATVSAMLGHRNISTTLDRYAYAIPGRGRMVANLMDSMVV